MSTQTIIEQGPLCARCGCYRSAHGEGERCEPVGWTFTAQSSAVLPSEAIERVARAGQELLGLAANGCPGMIEDEIDEWKDAITAMRATTPTAPVQDDDAELTCNCRELPHHPLCIENALLEPVRQMYNGAVPVLSPTPETGLVEALKEARRVLFEIYDHSPNGPTLMKIDAALSNVSLSDGK